MVNICVLVSGAVRHDNLYSMVPMRGYDDNVSPSFVVYHVMGFPLLFAVAKHVQIHAEVFPNVELIVWSILLVYNVHVC